MVPRLHVEVTQAALAQQDELQSKFTSPETRKAASSHSARGFFIPARRSQLAVTARVHGSRSR
ncbi:MAG: hypothetical protein P1U77_02690, partial [Rubripirellula sp.]|nr:hypothetical protein [Rubripirellula sp.]